MEWNENKAKEILKKHKSRFSLRLTLRILRVVVALIFLYTIYMVIINISYDKSNIGKRTEFYQQLAIDWTYPELTTDFGSFNKNEVTPFFTQKIDMSLVRTVGKKDYTVSELHLHKPIFNMFTRTEIDGTDVSHLNLRDHFSFYLPYNPKTNDKLSGNDSSEVWETLEIIHKGHVADMAVSLDDFYSPQEVSELLSPYDLWITWIPIYMGELTEYEEAGWGGGEDSIALQRPWGMTGGRVIAEDYMSGSMTRSLTAQSISESEEIMINHMETMLAEKKGLAETLLRTSYLQERYNYLKKNGFQAYGAIVTGPVKELLKLKEMEQVHSAQIGEIKYWNWND